jgi:hypothetical protein
MASARTAQLRDRLDVIRGEMDLAMKQVPIEYAKIAVYERQIDNLTEELKTCSSTTGELLRKTTTGADVCAVNFEHSCRQDMCPQIVYISWHTAFSAICYDSPPLHHH